MAPILVLDFGDVLFHWSTAKLTAMSPKDLHRIINHPMWASLECGGEVEYKALCKIASMTKLPLHTITAALHQCRTTLHVDSALLNKIMALKANVGLKVYAMTNVTEYDFKLMKEVLQDWSLFDGVYTSFSARSRKPDLNFFKHVLQDLGAMPGEVLFVDDKPANTDAAAKLGINCLTFNSADTLVKQLNAIYFDPQVDKGKAWLQQNARHLKSEIEGFDGKGPTFFDTFAQFLIMETTGNISLLNLLPLVQGEIVADQNQQILSLMSAGLQWNYFLEGPVGTTTTFPADVDSTSCALLAFRAKSGADEVLDSMLDNRNADGLVQTYWDPTRPRVDICVLTNVVRVFYAYGRGHEVSECLAFIHKALLSNVYASGTRHYCTPETFLFFMSQLVAANPDKREVQAFREPLGAALSARVGMYQNQATEAELALNPEDPYIPEVDSLAVAMRILACQALDIPAAPDVKRLKSLQLDDGSWPLGWVCRYGRTKARIGNRGVMTAYAVKALQTSAVRATVGAAIQHH